MALSKPDNTATFKEYMEYYMSRKNLSQSKLAERARLNQSLVNKIINGTTRFPQFDYLVCMALALQLTVKEFEDLISRIERAFSPADPTHAEFRKIIHIYAKKEFMIRDDVDFLDEADRFLRNKKINLPNVYR